MLFFAPIISLDTEEYNAENGIVPKTIVKSVRDLIDISIDDTAKSRKKKNGAKLTNKEKDELIEKLTKEMREAARHLEFEKAAFLRDKISEIRNSK